MKKTMKTATKRTKTIIAIALILLSCFSLSAMGGKEKGGKIRIGIAMPTKALQRWNQDGANMKQMFEQAGYEVELLYADNDIAQQISQIEGMINNGCSVLVVASIDGSSLGVPLKEAKANGIPVIAYDRLIMNTDAVDYYATFDNYMVGTIQGRYIEQTLNLKENNGRTYNMEIFSGDPGDNNALFYYDGAMDVLRPYLESGQLKVVSGQVTFAESAITNWLEEVAQNRMEAILSSFYADGRSLDIVLAFNDSNALGATNALVNNYKGSWPIITGQDCNIANLKNIIAGRQSMSVFKDTRSLASRVVAMVDALVKGNEVPVNDTTTYFNGIKTVPSYLCEPVFADINNYQELLVDSGYYTADQLK